MSKLKEHLIVSLEGSGIPITKVLVCYLSKKAIAQAVAQFLPYETVVIDGSTAKMDEEEMRTFSHAIEFSEPYGENYAFCKQQRLLMQELGCSVVCCFDWQESYLEDAFWGDVDYLEQSKMMKKVGEDLLNVDTFHITSDLGTDISFSTKGRKWIVADGLSKKVGMAQFPDGEIYTCPVEETFTGVLVVDGTVTRSWLPTEPQRLEFKEGKLVDCSKEFGEYIKHLGPDVYLIGEFALAFNTAHTKIVNNISVDEKAAGTVHFALGDSYNLGKNSCNCHVDMVIRKPKVTTTPNIKLPFFNC